MSLSFCVPLSYNFFLQRAKQIRIMILATESKKWKIRTGTNQECRYPKKSPVWYRSYGAGFIFTTSLPPTVLSGCLASIRVLRSVPRPFSVLEASVADQNPRSGAFTTWSGVGFSRLLYLGSRITNLDFWEFSDSFWIKSIIILGQLAQMLFCTCQK